MIFNYFKGLLFLEHASKFFEAMRFPNIKKVAEISIFKNVPPKRSFFRPSLLPIY